MPVQTFVATLTSETGFNSGITHNTNAVLPTWTVINNTDGLLNTNTDTVATNVNVGESITLQALNSKINAGTDYGKFDTFMSNIEDSSQNAGLLTRMSTSSLKYTSIQLSTDDLSAFKDNMKNTDDINASVGDFVAFVFDLKTSYEQHDGNYKIVYLYKIIA